MNYAFLSAAFFAFHLLLAYLVDHISIHAAFFISSIVSVFLVVTYLRLVAGTRFAVARAGLAQFVFLVLFSYAFFFEGYTGLTVTIGAIVTLFVLMQATARVDWGAVFAARREAGVMHVAIVMDGNGRWAARGVVHASAGHARARGASASSSRRRRRWASEVLTLYAFSADNWRRPGRRSRGADGALRALSVRGSCAAREAGVRLTVIGRRDRLPRGAPARGSRRRAADGRRLAPLAAPGDRLLGPRGASQAAAARGRSPSGRRRPSRAASERSQATPSATPDVDLLIRTGGEQRLSDFLLWECAYAEFWFTADSVARLRRGTAGGSDGCVHGQRDRRFGGFRRRQS